MHKASWGPAPGHQWQRHEWLVICLQSTSCWHNTVRGSSWADNAAKHKDSEIVISKAAARLSQNLILFWRIWQDGWTEGGRRVCNKKKVIKRSNKPCISGNAVAIAFLTDVASLNMSGMLHTILHLEATKVFLCIAILQIHKASHYLCVGGSGLPLHSLDCELKQIFSFPSLFWTSLEAFPLT